ncbi:hypothetical protein Q7P37_002808 [Cladosporium fusiforme]
MPGTRGRRSRIVSWMLVTFLLLLFTICILGAPTNPENRLTSVGDLYYSGKSIKGRADYSPPSESTDENDYDDDGDVHMGDNSDAASSSGDDEGAERGALSWEDYVRKGAQAATYLKSSDVNIVADLVQKGKLPQGSRLASKFTDVAALAANGWRSKDATAILRSGFEQYVPFRNALKTLKLSDEARPVQETRSGAKNEMWDYEHTLMWRKNGREMDPFGRLAQFSFVTNPSQATLIITLGYSTQYIIKLKKLYKMEIESPPLSHKSDIAFLEWKRACTKYRRRLEHLKHIFLSVILTEEMQEAVNMIFSKRGTVLDDFTKLPSWEKKVCLTPNTEAGKAMLGTIQMQGVVWMLLQHRTDLGHKSVKQMCIFKDTNEVDKGRGPSVYVELEDVSS